MLQVICQSGIRLQEEYVIAQEIAGEIPSQDGEIHMHIIPTLLISYILIGCLEDFIL